MSYGLTAYSAKEAAYELYPAYRRSVFCGVSGVIATGTIAHKLSKTAKDIGNVDGWREMK